jgi:crotonobetainyl-CoA:carnitine CoA-transferase CaiB-like acyl-CoA transferase
VYVLDLSRVLAGPWATQMLGDLGATVVKVEQPGRPDETRSWGPPFVDDGSGDAAYFLCANRNKTSIAVDFTTPEGAAQLRGLAARSDVLVENFKTGGLAKYGLDWPSLRAVNPRLVYCSITGFGQTGPYAQRTGYDLLIQAMSGLMSITGDREPTKVGVAVSDLFTGMYAVVSILAALRHRDATGVGQHIDLALLDCQVAALANQAMSYLVSGKVPERTGNAHPNIVPYRDFATSDGRIVVAVGNDGQFTALCEVLEVAEIARDARYADNRARVQHRESLEALLAAAFAKRSRHDILGQLEACGVPAGPINDLAAAFADPQVIARGLVRHIPRNGTQVPSVAFPARFSETTLPAPAAPPLTRS